MVFRKKTKKAPETFHFSQEEVSREGRFGTMRLAEDMRALAQEIASSFDARVATVAALRQETAAKLKGFRQEMKNIQHELRRKAADLRRFLGNAAFSRMREFQAMHQGIRARQEERNREMASMLNGFWREREAASGHWQHMAAAMAKKRAGLAR